MSVEFSHKCNSHRGRKHYPVWLEKAMVQTGPFLMPPFTLIVNVRKLLQSSNHCKPESEHPVSIWPERISSHCAAPMCEIIHAADATAVSHNGREKNIRAISQRTSFFSFLFFVSFTVTAALAGAIYATLERWPAAGPAFLSIPAGAR